MISAPILHLIGTLSLLGYGLGSLFLPERSARLIAQHLNSPRSMAEFRIVNGGYFTALAAFALVVNQPLVFAALGLGWLGAASARVLAVFLDRPRLGSLYIGLWCFEILMGVFLIIP